MNRPSFTIPALAIACATLASSPPARAQCGIEQELFPPSLQNNDEFGTTVDMDGDWLFAAAPGHSEPGAGSSAVYVFHWNGSSYDEVQRLFSDSATDISFGAALNVEGDLLVVGEPMRSSGRGKVHIFRLVGGVWAPEQEVTSSDAKVNKRFGRSLALDPVDRSRILIGSEMDTAEVFVRQGSNWAFEQELPYTSTATFYGRSVDLYGDFALVGAERHNQPQGRAFLYERQGGAWTEVAQLKSNDPPASANFGQVVKLRPERIAISTNAPTQGIELFVPLGEQWVFESTVSLTEPGFGLAFDFNANRMVVGSPLLGLTHVLDETPTGWELQHSFRPINPNPLMGAIKSGISVGLWNDKLITGAPAAYGFKKGAAYVYDLLDQEATAYCTAGTSAGNCQARVTATGTASASQPSGFTLSSCSVPGDVQGLFYYGTSGRQAAPWGNGSSYQCVTPPVKRAGLLPKRGQPGVCSATFAQDFNDYWTSNPSKNPGAGALVQAQFWYRDPFNTSNQTTSLSNAVEFTVNP